jgi:protein-tyrosine phosphatase
MDNVSPISSTPAASLSSAKARTTTQAVANFAAKFFRTVLAVPVMMLAAPLTLAMHSCQLLANPSEINAKKSLTFAMTYLVCGFLNLSGWERSQKVPVFNNEGQVSVEKVASPRYSFYNEIPMPNNLAQDFQGKLVLSAIPSTSDKNRLVNENTKGTVILDMTCKAERVQTPIGHNVTPKEWEKAGITYKNIEVDDLHPVDLKNIDKAVGVIEKALKAGKTIDVHCKAGVGRSATVVIGFLIKNGMSASEAITHVAKHRSINLNEKQVAQLFKYEGFCKMRETANSGAGLESAYNYESFKQFNALNKSFKDNARQQELNNKDNAYILSKTRPSGGVVDEKQTLQVRFENTIFNAFDVSKADIICQAYTQALSGDIPKTIRNKLLILTDDEKEKLKKTFDNLEKDNVFETGFAKAFYNKLFPS